MLVCEDDCADPLFRAFVITCLEKWRWENNRHSVLPHARHGPCFVFWEGKICDGRGKDGNPLTGVLMTLGAGAGGGAGNRGGYECP